MDNNNDAGTPMTYWQHLDELRYRLWICLCGMLLCSVLGYLVYDHIQHYLLTPLLDSLTKANYPHKIIYTELAEAFLIKIKVSIYFGFLSSMPLILLQVYKFIAPSIDKRLRPLSIGLIIASCVLFISGCMFAKLVVIPTAWRFFLEFEQLDIPIPLVLEAKISNYLNLTMKIIICFGISFQIPLFLLLLNIIGFIDTVVLVRLRKFALLANFIIAAVVTPPDLFSQIILGLVLQSMYELAILLIKLLEKRIVNVRHQIYP